MMNVGVGQNMMVRMGSRSLADRPLASRTGTRRVRPPARRGDTLYIDTVAQRLLDIGRVLGRLCFA